LAVLLGDIERHECPNQAVYVGRSEGLAAPEQDDVLGERLKRDALVKRRGEDADSVVCPRALYVDRDGEILGS
jgi:hypothetical protein